MKSYTMKQAVEKYGLDGQKRAYNNKYSLTEAQKASLEANMYCVYKSVQRTKNDLGKIIYVVGEERELMYPKISVGRVFGNNSKDNLNPMLFQYVLNFLEENTLNEEEFYTETHLESKFDILSNFSRMFVQYSTGGMIINNSFENFNKTFSSLRLTKENQYFYLEVYHCLKNVVSDFRKRLREFVTNKLSLYTQKEFKSAVLREEVTQFNNHEDLTYYLRGNYDNLSLVMPDYHDRIIDGLNDILNSEYKYSDAYNNDEKTFRELSYIQNFNDTYFVEVDWDIYEDISDKISSKQKELNLVTRYHGRKKPVYLNLEKIIEEIKNQTESNEEEIEAEIKYYSEVFNILDDRNNNYETQAYIIGNDGDSLELNDRIKLLEKYKHKYYRLKNDSNQTYYEIQYFSTYYQFTKNLLGSAGYTEYLYNKMGLTRDRNLSGIKIQLRNICKDNFEKEINKQMRKNYDYLKGDGFDFMQMNEIVSRVCGLILKS